MAVYTDAFTDTDGVALATHDANWVIQAGTMTILTNQVKWATGTGTGYRYNQTFADKHYSQITLVVAGGQAVGPSVRNASGNNYYYTFHFSADKIYFGQMIAGTPTDWDAGLTPPANSSVILLTVDATTSTTIIAKDDGVTIATYTSKSALSGGQAGISIWNAAGRGDDWEGGDVAAGAAVWPMRQNIYNQAVNRAATY